jgi:hypothetical protein
VIGGDDAAYVDDATLRRQQAVVDVQARFGAPAGGQRGQLFTNSRPIVGVDQIQKRSAAFQGVFVVSEEFRRLGRDVGEPERASIHFPRNGMRTFHEQPIALQVGAELRRADVNHPLELHAVPLQLRVALLDVVEHLVECLDELAHLVVADLRHAQSIAPIPDHGTGSLRQVEQRSGHDALQSPPDRSSQCDRAKQAKSQGPPERPEAGIQFRQLELHVHRAGELAIQRDRAAHRERGIQKDVLPALFAERAADDFQDCGMLAGLSVPLVAGEHAAPWAHDGSRHDLLVDAHGAQGLRGRDGVPELQGGRAVRGDHIEDDAGVFDQALT